MRIDAQILLVKQCRALWRDRTGSEPPMLDRDEDKWDDKQVGFAQLIAACSAHFDEDLDALLSLHEVMRDENGYKN